MTASINFDRHLEQWECMAENLAIFDFALDEDDVAGIVTLETGQSSFFTHRDPAIVTWMYERRLDI